MPHRASPCVIPRKYPFEASVLCHGLRTPIGMSMPWFKCRGSLQMHLVKSRVTQELRNLAVETAYDLPRSWVFQVCIMIHSIQLIPVQSYRNYRHLQGSRQNSMVGQLHMIPNLQVPPSNHQADGISVSHHHSLEGCCVCLRSKARKSPGGSFSKMFK